jgi:hypothetical protein
MAPALLTTQNGASNLNGVTNGKPLKQQQQQQQKPQVSSADIIALEHEYGAHKYVRIHQRLACLYDVSLPAARARANRRMHGLA